MSDDAGARPDRLVAWRAFLTAHARVVERLAHELVEVCDLQLSWYDVMVQLAEAPDDRLRMQELADAVLLSKSGLTRLIDRMETAGLVAREASPDDRRGTFACLTRRGRDTLRRCSSIHLAGVHEHFTSLLDDDEAAVLARALGRVADAARTSTSS